MYYTTGMDTSSKSASRSQGMITCDLGHDLKSAWIAWCESKGLVSSKALRGLVEKALSEGLEINAVKQGVTVKVVLTDCKEKDPSVAKKIVFTASETAAVDAVAQAQGYSFNAWVIAAVRAALANATSYGQQEIEALVASNAEMAKIAIELAALRRRGGAVEPELESLEKAVREHVERVSAILSAGVERWAIKISR